MAGFAYDRTCLTDHNIYLIRSYSMTSMKCWSEERGNSSCSLKLIRTSIRSYLFMEPMEGAS